MEPKAASPEAGEHVYRIQGLTCTHCASVFEHNVKHLPGVVEAQVNFGAAKLTVVGSATVAELEKAGSFENVKVVPEKQRKTEQERTAEQRRQWWKQYRNVLVAALLLVAGYVLGAQYGEGNVFAAAACAAAMAVGGYGLFHKGIRRIVRLQFDMNALMTMAVAGAAAIGEWSEGATVVILFAVSEALERYSMDKARQSIRSLMDIAPKEALVRRGREQTTVHVDDIRIGDVMIVKPGQPFAMDGVVVRGTSTVHQAAITGESAPVTKTANDEVFAGTFNEDGLLEVKVTKRVEDTTISNIIRLVEEAQAKRAPSQTFVDRFAAYYTPAILMLALGIAVIPPLAAGADWGDWIYRGLAALVVGCPCALVISTPVSIVTAIGHAAKHGVLIKGGIHLEEAGGVSAIAFDKTGTLTKGLPEVTDFIPFGNDEHTLLSIAAAIERGSQHPLASAVVRKAAAAAAKLPLPDMSGFRSVTGKGVQADINGELYYIGNPNWFRELHGRLNEPIAQRVEQLQQQGKTVMILGTGRDILALMAVADDVRDSAKSVIRQLHDIGIRRTVMLTGDNAAAARAIGNRLDMTEVKADLLPQHKLEYIRQLRHRCGKVAMVGDGVNDAPALAAATVGVAMGGAGTEAALDTADIVLMADDLSKLPYTIRLSRKTLAIIKQNITFSLGVKLAALCLIAPGWLTLWLAVFADMGATLLVTLNSLRLLKIKGGRS